MNQVEIAKKILEQGNCRKIECSDDECPLHFIPNDCQGNMIKLNQQSVTKLQVFIKERENMIDLNVNQIVDPPVKCWVRNDETDKWRQRWLVATANEGYFTISNIDHNIEETPTLLDIFRRDRARWRYCSLTDPTIQTKKIKKWLTVEDVPVELWNKALVKSKDGVIYGSFGMQPYNISYSDGTLRKDLVYLPLGQPLTGEWLPFESEE